MTVTIILKDNNNVSEKFLFKSSNRIFLLDEQQQIASTAQIDN
jgi:hypothetical protein